MMVGIVIDSYNLNGSPVGPGTDSAMQIDNSGTHRVAQNFIASANYTCFSAVVGLKKSGSPGNITAEIYAIDGSGQPTGAALSTGTTDGNTLVDASENNGEVVTWREIFMSQYQFTTSTEYSLVLSCSGADGTNTPFWWFDLSASPSQEENWSYNGSSWSSLPPTWGLWFGVTQSPINPDDKRYTRNIVTFSNNKVYYGPNPSNVTELVAASDDIDCSKPLRACEAYGKVFVANHDVFKVADFVNVKITTTNIGANIPYHGDIIRGATSNAVMVVDYVDAASGAATIYGNKISTEDFEAETVTGTNKNDESVSFTGTAQVTGPFWYDWTPYANDTTNFGEMPAFASIVELHIGRVWLSGDSRYPHQWYGTRQNNPFDFLYAQNDAGSAVAGNNTDAGEAGDIMIDMISYSDDYMLMGCAGKLFVMLGNPCAGGRINLARTSGLLAPRAWCWDNDQTLFLLSVEGLLMIPKGFGQAENITKERYPDFIKDLVYNPNADRISMAYDHENHGITIQKVTMQTGANECWFLDLRTGGFFPEEYPEEAVGFSLWNFVADDPDDRTLLIGSADGHIRYWDSTTKNDDAGGTGDEAIDAYVGFAPVKTSESLRRRGRVSGIDVITGGDEDGGAGDSDQIYVKVYSSNAAQKLIKDVTSGANPRYTKTVKAPGHPKGNVDRRKIGGRWAGFVIGNNTAGESFAFEELNVNTI